MPSHPDRFVDRHIGPRPADLDEMLRALSCRDIDELIARTVPASTAGAPIAEWSTRCTYARPAASSCRASQVYEASISS